MAVGGLLCRDAERVLRGLGQSQVLGAAARRQRVAASVLDDAVAFFLHQRGGDVPHLVDRDHGAVVPPGGGELPHARPRVAARGDRRRYGRCGRRWSVDRRGRGPSRRPSALAWRTLASRRALADWPLATCATGPAVVFGGLGCREEREVRAAAQCQQQRQRGQRGHQHRPAGSRIFRWIGLREGVFARRRSRRVGGRERVRPPLLVEVAWRRVAQQQPVRRWRDDRRGWRLGGAGAGDFFTGTAAGLATTGVGGGGGGSLRGGAGGGTDSTGAGGAAAARASSPSLISAPGRAPTSRPVRPWPRAPPPPPT